ncbi:MAG: acylphosphatase [Planctomycetota bacterium]|jgi:acylphosphatase
MNSVGDMMAARKCCQFIVKDKVQDRGLRLAIAKLIPDELDVRADNMPDGSVRVVVKGQKKEVVEFWKALHKEVLGKADNPGLSDPKDMLGMSIATDRFFHKLQCEQMEKFVDVGLEMKSSIDTMSGKIDDMNSGLNSKLDVLPKNIAKELANLKKNGFF